MITLKEKLFELQDISYKEFHQRLMPTIDADRIIGIRTPVLRKFAKGFSKTDQAAEFLRELPHYYYEENNLHAFTVAQIKDFDRALEETRKFVPYIDNWATCDCFLPTVFKKNKSKLLPDIYAWIQSGRTYSVRYGIGLLMSLFLDEDFDASHAETIAAIHSEEYYVNMMIAWYFATALAKQPEAAMPYITEHRLDKWVHNKTIQKACESYRISSDMKSELKKYKIR